MSSAYSKLFHGPGLGKALELGRGAARPEALLAGSILALSLTCRFGLGLVPFVANGCIPNALVQARVDFTLPALGCRMDRYVA